MAICIFFPFWYVWTKKNLATLISIIYVRSRKYIDHSEASPDQGDQIGLIFAHWVTVYFGFFVNYRSSQNFVATIHHCKSYLKFVQKRVGLHFRRFLQTHLVTLPEIDVMILELLSSKNWQIICDFFTGN
jgi:hypothetical protein